MDFKSEKRAIMAEAVSEVAIDLLRELQVVLKYNVESIDLYAI